MLVQAMTTQLVHHLAEMIALECQALQLMHTHNMAC